MLHLYITRAGLAASALAPAQAVEAYVRQHSEEDVTELLNKVYAGSSAQLDPALEAGSLEVLRRESWE